MIDVSRRTLVAGSLAAVPLALLGCRNSFAQAAADWPDWAPTRAALRARLGDLAKNGADIRRFGARMDGSTDDADALERALAGGARAVTIPYRPGAVLRIGRQVRIAAPVAILGVGGVPLVRFDGREDALFLAYPEATDPAVFLTGIEIDGLKFSASADRRKPPTVVEGYNLRKFSVSRCRTEGMGLVQLHHARQRLKLYDRTKGAIDSDPAVAAGFSATATDDLNEDVFIYDNEVDALRYMGQIIRFDFARRVAVAGNTGRFANISWWGGGARRNEGGDGRFLRRARDIYVADNIVSGANGGVYGNNGDGVVVARNHVSDMTDVGIDFEGCFNATAYENVVENAGNYCFATFYAARNIVFRNNVGLQDGTARDLAARFGRGRYGRMQGDALFAMRSGGFATTADQDITIKLAANRLTWKGADELGRILTSYFGRLELAENIFENVACVLSYPRTGTVAIRGNRFAFDRAAAAPVRLCATNARHIEIVDNSISSTRGLPEGSTAILVDASARTLDARIAGNRIESPAPGLPIVLRGAPPPAATVAIDGNQVDRLFADNPGVAHIVGNRTRSGAAVMPLALPAAFQLPSEPAAPSSTGSDEPAGGAVEDGPA